MTLRHSCLTKQIKLDKQHYPTPFLLCRPIWFTNPHSFHNSSTKSTPIKLPMFLLSFCLPIPKLIPLWLLQCSLPAPESFHSKVSLSALKNNPLQVSLPASKINSLQTSFSAFKSLSAFESLPALQMTPDILTNLSHSIPKSFHSNSPFNFKSTFFKVHFPFSNHSTPKSPFLIPSVSLQISHPVSNQHSPKLPSHSQIIPLSKAPLLIPNIPLSIFLSILKSFLSESFFLLPNNINHSHNSNSAFQSFKSLPSFKSTSVTPTNLWLSPSKQLQSSHSSFHQSITIQSSSSIIQFNKSPTSSIKSTPFFSLFNLTTNQKTNPILQSHNQSRCNPTLLSFNSTSNPKLWQSLKSKFNSINKSKLILTQSFSTAFLTILNGAFIDTQNTISFNCFSMVPSLTPKLKTKRCPIKQPNSKEATGSQGPFNLIIRCVYKHVR